MTYTPDILATAFELAERRPEFREAFDALADAINDEHFELSELEIPAPYKPIDIEYHSIAHEAETIRASNRERFHIYRIVTESGSEWFAIYRDIETAPYAIVAGPGIAEAIAYAAPYKLPPARVRRDLADVLAPVTEDVLDIDDLLEGI